MIKERILDMSKRLVDVLPDSLNIESPLGKKIYSMNEQELDSYIYDLIDCLPNKEIEKEI